MANHVDQYKDSRWQKLRLKIMERDGWKCRSCGKGDGDGITLNVHHAVYEAGCKVWEYPPELLVTWCQECHKGRHHLTQSLLVNCTEMDRAAFDGLFSLTQFKSAHDFLRSVDEEFDFAALAKCAEALSMQREFTYVLRSEAE